MRKLLVLENDIRIDEDRHMFVCEFVKNYDGGVTYLTGLKGRERSEIFEAVQQADDIAAQTALASGSEYQFDMMAYMLSKIAEPKNIYITLLSTDLKKYMDENLDDATLHGLSKHNIFELSLFEEPKKIEFAARVGKFENKIQKEQAYRNSARQRPTGLKVTIISVNANGKPFQGLPIGEEVDTLDMLEQDPNPSRGVWVWGNGEPVKLVNDGGPKEYKVCSGNVSPEIVVNYIKLLAGNKWRKRDNEDYQSYVEAVANDEHYSTSLANEFCDLFKIQKRGNRAVICELINSARAKIEV